MCVSVCVCVSVSGPYAVHSPVQVHQNWSYNVAGLFRVCSLEGYTVETGILDGMDETYKMFALPERIDSLLCRHVLDEEPLDNLKNLWKYIKQQQKRNRIRNKYQQRLCKLSMFQKQKDFPKLKGKASEIKGLCATFVDMWNYFVLDTEEYRKLAVLLKLNKEFEDVLSQYPVSQGYFALPADAARKLVQNLRVFGALYVHLSDYYKDQENRVFNMTSKLHATQHTVERSGDMHPALTSCWRGEDYMGKVSKMMMSCVKGVNREEASYKLNMKNRLALHLEWIKV